MKKYISVLILIFFLSCNNDDELIDGPGGSAEFYINNQTDRDLEVNIIRSEQILNGDNILVDMNRTLFFEDFSFGNNPTPENSFDEILFFLSPKETEDEPILSITEIINEDWNIFEQNLNENGLGQTKYQLTLTSSDLE